MKTSLEKSTNCVCCKKCENCSTGFHRVMGLKKSGLIIYRHATQTEDINMDKATKAQEDVYILHNTKDIDITSADYLPEIENLKISCARCRKLIEHAQKLAESIPIISRYDVLGVCDHCLMKEKSCFDCDKIVKQFISDKKILSKPTKEGIKLWLFKIKHLLKDIPTTSEDDGRKIRANSELHIDQLLRKSSMSTREIFERDLYKPHVGRSNRSKGSDLHSKKEFERQFDSLKQTSEDIGQSFQINEFPQTSFLPDRDSVSHDVDSRQIKFQIIDDIPLVPFHSIVEIVPEQAQSNIEYYRSQARVKSACRKPQNDINDKQYNRSTLHSNKIILQQERITDNMYEYLQFYPDSAYAQKNMFLPKAEKKHRSDKNLHQELTTPSAVIRKCHSEESIFIHNIGELLKNVEFEKDFSYYFPKEISKTEHLKQQQSSSELIKVTKDKIKAKAEEDEKMKEEARKKKIKEDERKRIAREEKQRLAEEKRRQMEDQKRLHSVDIKRRENIDNQDKEKPIISSSVSKSKESTSRSTSIKSKAPKIRVEKEPKAVKDISEKQTLKSEKEADKARKLKEQKEEKERAKQEKEKAKQEKEKARQEKEAESKEKARQEKEKARQEKEAQNQEKDKARQEKEAQNKEKARQEKEAQNKEKEKSKQVKETQKEEKDTQEEDKEKDKQGKEALKEDKEKAKKEEDARKEENERVRKELEAQKQEKEKAKKEREELMLKNKEEKAKEEKLKEDKIKKSKEDEQKAKEALSKLNKTSETTVIKPTPAKPKAAEKANIKELSVTRIKTKSTSPDDLILELVRLKKMELRDKKSKDVLKTLEKDAKTHKVLHKARADACVMCIDSDIEFEVDNYLRKKQDLKDSNKTADIIIGQNILKYKPPFVEKQEETVVPLLYKTTFEDTVIAESPTNKELNKVSTILIDDKKKDKTNKQTKSLAEQDLGKGVIRFALSDRSFIDKGWTMLPTEKVVRKMNVYRMRPAHPEFDWFEHNKSKRLMQYDSGEKLAEFDDNGRGRWFYKNGRMALDYYDAEEANAHQRFVIYSSGEPDERGRAQPYTILATFDHLGNGVVFDHSGKIRLKYNQTEGVILDRSIGPVSHWKWHTLNDPPVLQQVMIDTQMAHKDPKILKLGGAKDDKTRPDNEEMLAIEFDNFIREKSKKMSQSFKPFQIKMKALKINEHFSLKVLDQATVYLIFRDGTTNLKLNIGMILDHKEIVDTDTAEVGVVSNTLETFPARTDSLAVLQKNIAYAQRFENIRSGRERRLRHPEPISSADKLTAATSKPLRPPLRSATSCSTIIEGTTYCKCRKPSPNNVYYNTRIF